MNIRAFGRRLQQAETIAADALNAFDKAAEDLELASRKYRQVHDDIQAQLDELTNLQADARTAGERAAANAQKLRSFFA